jgi:formate hydrogenlyase subunit 6/NADH:ubiquinone oxidoreductase subunit I
MAQMSILKVVLGSLFSKPVTRKYPFVKRDPFKATRGHIGIEINKCTFCSLCSKKCPTDAITVNRQEKLWTIDRLRCIACSACVDACPKKCLSMENMYSPAQVKKQIDSFHQEAVAAPATAESSPVETTA